MNRRVFPKFIFLFILIGLIAVCIPTGNQLTRTPTDDEKKEALSTFRNFFDHLADENYKLAVTYYGGSYEVLQDNNPTLNPDNDQELLRNACEINGFQCLRVNEIVDIKETSPNKFVISAIFITGDGDIFVRGPCCGASEEDMPPESIFEFRVIKDDSGEYKVLDLPVYVP